MRVVGIDIINKRRESNSLAKIIELPHSSKQSLQKPYSYKLSYEWLSSRDKLFHLAS